MKKESEIQYGKCLKCNRELPSEGFIDGLCAECLLDKHYCEDCEHCELADQKNADQALRFAKCKVSPKQGDHYNEAMLSKRFDTEPQEYFFCTSERTSDQCEKFKFHVGA